MVQQIEFIIHTNIQPLPVIFQGQGQRFKKILVKAIIIGSLQFFHVKLPMSMDRDDLNVFFDLVF